MLITVVNSVLLGGAVISMLILFFAPLRSRAYRVARIAVRIELVLVLGLIISMLFYRWGS